MRGEAKRIEAYLNNKFSNFPDWWNAQSLRSLTRMAQIFGVLYEE